LLFIISGLTVPEYILFISYEQYKSEKMSVSYVETFKGKILRALGIILFLFMIGGFRVLLENYFK